MKSNLRPACLVFVLAIAACDFTRPVATQPPRADLVAINEIVDVVLGELIPAGKRVSRVPVAQRMVFFDHERTMAAFGHPNAPPLTLSGLRRHTPVQPGSKTLVDDCVQGGSRPCDQLGWGVYVWVEPRSRTSSEALVRAYLLWPDRGGVAFQHGVAPTGRATLVGFIAQLFLTRSPDGSWKVGRRDPTMVFE